MTCQWFAGCTNESTCQVHHPTIGWVECCQVHLDWLGPTPSPTQFVPPIVARYHNRLAAILVAAEGDTDGPST